MLTAGRLIHEGRSKEAIAILERTGVLPPAPEVTRLRYMAIAQTQRDRPEFALELLDQAEAIAAEVGDAVDHAWIAFARAGAHRKAGSPAEAVRVLEAAVATFEQGSVVDAVLHFRLVADLGQALAEAGRSGEALVALDRSLERSEPYVESSSRASGYWALAEAQQANGNDVGAEYYRRKSVYLREDIRMLDGIAIARATAAELRGALRPARRTRRGGDDG